MTEELSRTSALASRHRALGSGLEDWNGMGTAWTYKNQCKNKHSDDNNHQQFAVIDRPPMIFGG